MSTPHDTPPAAERTPAVHPWADTLRRASNAAGVAAPLYDRPQAAQLAHDAAQLWALAARLDVCDLAMVAASAEWLDSCANAATHDSGVAQLRPMAYLLRSLAAGPSPMVAQDTGPTPPGADA